MPNIYSDEFDGQAGRGLEPPAGFGGRYRTMGARAGAERLGASVWEVPPGTLSYPYHYHLADEEMIVVISGDGRLRTPAGWRPLIAGEVIAFPRGEDGAHQFACDGPEPLRFLAVSTIERTDVCGYPDSGKIAVREQRPGGLWRVFRDGDHVPYWLDETPERRPRA